MDCNPGPFTDLSLTVLALSPGNTLEASPWIADKELPQNPDSVENGSFPLLRPVSPSQPPLFGLEVAFEAVVRGGFVRGIGEADRELKADENGVENRVLSPLGASALVSSSRPDISLRLRGLRADAAGVELVRAPGEERVVVDVIVGFMALRRVVAKANWRT